MTGERRRLMADALHHATVTGDHEREVVLGLGTEAGPQVLLGDGHADCVRESLTERPGRDLDAGGVTGFRVARCGGIPLAEVLQVVELEPVAAEEEQRVLQDRRVTVREHEPVAIGPGRIGRIVLHHPAEEHVAERGERHGGALMPAVGGERAVHRHPPDERDGELVLFLGQRHAADSTRPPPTRNQPGLQQGSDPCCNRQAGGRREKGTRCQGPWSMRQCANTWP